jgi:hypothetical protein
MALSTLVFSFGLSSGHHAFDQCHCFEDNRSRRGYLDWAFQPVFVLQKPQAKQKGVKSHNYCRTKAVFALVQSSK